MYLGVWIFCMIEICQGSEFDKNTEGSEYARVWSQIMLK